VLRSSYLHVGIRLFAVLTSSTWLSTLQLYGSDISNAGFSFFAALVGLEKLGIPAGVCLVSICSLKTEDVDVAACVSSDRERPLNVRTRGSVRVGGACGVAGRILRATREVFLL
jgi:hypothetical protein